MLEKYRRMREGKDRKRLREVQALVDVGGFVTDGVFGKHVVRCLARNFDEPWLYVTVDGAARRPRSFRGVMRVMALMMEKKRVRPRITRMNADGR